MKKSAPLANAFKNKTALVTGGTGSFGRAVIAPLLKRGVREIRIFSRDELKQELMRIEYADPRLKFFIGDVRSRESVDQAMAGVDFVFHAAALKQVPSCDFFPMQAVLTNVIGSNNVIESAIAQGVGRVICLSTDKAVYPINAMGMSKAMMEKVMIAKSRNLDPGRTILCGTRYGNVMASRGSVIPLFIEQVRRGTRLTITDPAMTRFMMTLEDALDLVLHAFVHGTNGDIFVQKAPSVRLDVLARAVLAVLDKRDHGIDVIGTRHGEKLYETLLSREEMARAQDLGRYYRIPPDLRDLDSRKFVEEGEPRISELEDYNSHNVRRLDLQEMQEMLRGLTCIRDAREGLREPDRIGE